MEVTCSSDHTHCPTYIRSSPTVFFILPGPLFHQWLCVWNKRQGPFLSPLLVQRQTGKTILCVSCLSFGSEDMKTAVWSFLFWLRSLIFTMWLTWTVLPTESLRIIFYATFNAWQSNSWILREVFTESIPKIMAFRQSGKWMTQRKALSA